MKISSKIFSKLHLKVEHDFKYVLALCKRTKSKDYGKDEMSVNENAFFTRFFEKTAKMRSTISNVC